jgi:hypothetical protein
MNEFASKLCREYGTFVAAESFQQLTDYLHQAFALALEKDASDNRTESKLTKDYADEFTLVCFAKLAGICMAMCEYMEQYRDEPMAAKLFQEAKHELIIHRDRSNLQ